MREIVAKEIYICSHFQNFVLCLKFNHLWNNCNWKHPANIGLMRSKICWQSVAPEEEEKSPELVYLIDSCCDYVRQGQTRYALSDHWLWQGQWG